MPFISSAISALRRLLSRAVFFASTLWARFRALRPRYQWAIGILAAVLIIALFAFGNGGAEESADTLPAVSLEAVGTLSGGDGATNFFGSVESVSEAEVLAKTSGTVTRVSARVGQTVAAGAVLASLENAAESAAVLSAEGSYEAALASRSITAIGADDAEEGARSTYKSAYATIDSALEVYADPLLSGTDRVQGVTLDITDDRYALSRRLSEWRNGLNTADATDPSVLLSQAEAIAREADAFIGAFARVVNASDSGASATARAGIASARSSISGAVSSITSARSSLEVAARQTDSSSGATASADASVKQALGALRSAQAAYERTVVRAPISGTVNFLPIKVGDYVTAMTHAATVARNGALEITAFVSPESRESLSVGDKVVIDEKTGGTITTIAPALDPVRKQIEVRVAADNASSLVNGQSVRVRLASAPKVEVSQGPILLPLSAVKLSSGSRAIFTVDEGNRLVARAVEVGEVRGDRIEILGELPLDLLIVRDARGLSNGQEVRIAGGASASE